MLQIIIFAAILIVVTLFAALRLYRLDNALVEGHIAVHAWRRKVSTVTIAHLLVVALVLLVGQAVL